MLKQNALQTFSSKYNVAVYSSKNVFLKTSGSNQQLLSDAKSCI